MSVQRVAVVGGGIIGVSSALRIKESLPGSEVSLMADKFSPDTTGDGSAGFIMPYAVGLDTDPELVRRWCVETMAFLKGIAVSEDSGKCGVNFIQAYWINQTEVPLTDYPDILLKYEPMTETLLSMFPKEYRFGWTGTAIYAECKRLLPKLMKRFEALGGKIITRRVNQLQELSASYDVVVNCTGIGAAALVPDPLVYPIRGQVIKVKAPWIKHCLITPDFHVLPGNEIVTLGGTKQKDNWSREVDPEDRKRIWNGCCQLIPSLKYAEVVQDWVGLRPGRDCVRLETETLCHEGKSIQVIHNYGHGGSGVSLFWGCAGDVADLIKCL